MKCNKCNRENEATAQFCVYCGSPLTGQAPSNPAYTWKDSKEGKFVLQYMSVRKKDWLVKKLVSKFKMSQSDAERLYDTIKAELEEYKKTPAYRREMAKKGRNTMIAGIAWAGGGILITLITYAAASPGGVFYVFWGAVLWGIIYFFIGLSQWLKYRETTGTTASAAYTPVVPQKPTPSSQVNNPPANPVQTVSEAPQTVVYPLVRARLIMPDKSEVVLPLEETTFGRTDFEKVISATASPYISRQHFKIKADGGKYYIYDNNSSNGTRLNGIDIRGIGWQELRNDDRIDIAQMVAFTFRTDSPKS